MYNREKIQTWTQLGTNFVLALLFSLGFYNMFFILRPILYDDPDMVGHVGVYAGPFLFFTNIDLVVQAAVNWLFFLGHVMKPVREIGRILQSAFGFWGGIACTIEFWGLFFISPGLVQSVKFMERADNLPVNWEFQNNVIHTLPLISAFANAILWPPRIDNLTRKMALLIQLVYFSAMIYVYFQIQDFPYGFMHHLGIK